MRTTTIPTALSRTDLFTAYAVDHACGFTNGRRHDGASLVAINPRGARVLLRRGEGDVAPGEACVLDSRLYAGGASLDGLRCRVRWVKGREIGIEFDAELGVTATDLHAALGDRRAA